MSKFLNIAAFLRESRVNGPGTRFVLWLQGCSHKCPGCYNSVMQSEKDVELMSVPYVYSLIMEDRDAIDGVTYTGGEPFDQAAGLFDLTQKLKKKGLSVISYSGYTVDALQNDTDYSKKKLLEALDLLIDGPFLQKQSAGKGWRGSTNQKCHIHNAHVLTKNCDADNAMEIIINDNGDISLTGFFPRDIETQIKEKLGAYDNTSGFNPHK